MVALALPSARDGRRDYVTDSRRARRAPLSRVPARSRRRRTGPGPRPTPRSPSRTASAAICLRARAASSGSRPSASCAASAEEWVQPEPCAAPSGWRSPGISTSRSPSKKRSVACSRCPPVTTTARGPSAWTARASSSASAAPRRPSPRVQRSSAASGRFGRDDRGPRHAAASASAVLGVLVEQAGAALGDHHRVEDHRHAPAPGRAPRPRPRSSRRCRACRS